MRRRHAEQWRRVLSASALLFCGPVFGQNTPPAKPVDLEAASLPLRTALYHDPTLTAPLERLLQLYREAGRGPELVATYRQHLVQFPADTGALIIFARLLVATNDAQQGAVIKAAAAKFPDHAYLQFLHFEHLQRSHAAGALEALDRAIAKETLPSRQRAWIEQLVPLAIAAGRPELAQQRLETLAASVPSAEGKLEIARKMIAQKLYASALNTLEAAAAQKPTAETGVDLDLAAASAELGLQRDPAAGLRLDRLLGRLAPDYWRRNEILHRRTALVKTDKDRETMLSSARARMKAAPLQEGPALELAQLLTAFEFRREALDLLLEAGGRVTTSEKLEKATLDLFDLLRDERGREAFLAARLRLAPNREDLALAHTRTLFLLGRREEALAVFDPLAAKLDASARLTQVLELARFLRRSSIHTEATILFERAVELAPTRLDVRRELAETWLALGQKEKARAVFRAKIPAETETENLLDLIQFFLKQEMFAEARSALAERLLKEPQNFDLRLMQLTVATRFADQALGEDLVKDTRAIADTEARYRRWLESAAVFYQISENEPAFFAAEQERLLATPGGWSGENRERRLIFSEVAAAHGRKKEVAEFLNGALSGEQPAEVRIDLRRRQAALLESDPARAATAEEQLQALIVDDSARETEYRIRLALMAAREKRNDKLASLLKLREGALDVSKVNDAPLLTGLEGVLSTQGGLDAKLLTGIVERLTVLEPTKRAHWERWVSMLALSSNEEKLQTVLRRLLAGVDRMPLDEDVQKLLKEHLLASLWRSTATLMANTEADPQRLAEALPALDAAERLAESRTAWLWINWTRAYLLNRLERPDARDEAIRELERVAALPPETGSSAKEGAAGAAAEIVFPDGLVIALAQARGLLTSPSATGPVPTASASLGPRGPFKVRWAFETENRSGIFQILPQDAQRLILIDQASRLYSVDASSGKLRWSKAGSVPLAASATSYDDGVTVTANGTPIIEAGRIYLPMGDGVECWGAEDGKLLWRASGLRDPGTQVYPSLFAHAGRILVCDPITPKIFALDPATGKVVWEREYASEPALQPLSAANSGASFSDGRIFLYGRTSLIVNASNGEVQWRFTTEAVKAFPFSLAEATAPAPATVSQPTFRSGRATWSSSLRGGGLSFNAIDYQSLAFNQRNGWSPQAGQQIMLANGGAAWSRGENQGQWRYGLLKGQRLILFSAQGMSSMRLDVPFSKNVRGNWGSGREVGCTGRFVCLGVAGGVISYDFESGATNRLSLPRANQDEPENDEAEETQQGDWNGRQSAGTFTPRAAVDGPLLYLTGPQGISLFHLRTGQLIASAPWPPSVAPAKAGPMAEESSRLMPQRAGRYNRGGMPQENSFARAVVGDGVLYTEAQPGRLVALISAP